LILSPEQEALMDLTVNACRKVYNQVLGDHIQARAIDPQVKFKYTEAAACLPRWKKGAELGWIKEAPSQPLQQSLKDLETSFKRFFKKVGGFPTFHAKGRKDSFRFPSGFVIEEENARISLPKIGFVRYINSLKKGAKKSKIQGVARNLTISKRNNKWYVSIQTQEVVKNAPVPTATKAIGIDLGVTNFVTLSDGTVFNHHPNLEKKIARLKHYQKILSRKVKGSQNRKKARLKVGKCYEQIANMRKDHLNKVSKQLVDNYALIAVEDLDIVEMTEAEPGKNKRNEQNLRQAWGILTRMVEYKQAWAGGMTEKVNPAYTSQECSICGHIEKGNRKTQSQFKCLACGHEENADINAAKNVLNRAHQQLAGGQPVSAYRSPAPNTSLHGVGTRLTHTTASGVV
jgi:putative transposase